MPNLPAARVGDDIAHSNAGLGMALGIGLGVVAGVVLVGATVATGGGAVLVVGAVGGAMGMTSLGGLGGKYIGEASMGSPCGKFVTGSPNVFINNRPATFTFGSTAACSKDSAPQQLATGAASVLINFGLAGRRDEKTACSAKSVDQVSPNVLIGGQSAQDPRVQITPEVPEWAVTGLKILGVAGMVLALPYGIATLGVAGLAGTTALGAIGSTALSYGGRALGEALGLSESAIRSMEVAGGLLGGLLGGRAGVSRIQANRRNLAQDYYQRQGWPQARIDSHMKGIDFRYPVREINELPANMKLGQWQVPGGQKGNYFAPLNDTPSRLGISTVGHDPSIGAVSKVQTTYISSRPTSALQTKAAGVIDDWSSPYGSARTTGGGTQYFVPDPGAFKP